MSVQLTVCDETATGDAYNEVLLVFPSEQITVRELIRERVYQEVQDFNRAQGAAAFRGLVQPTDAERVLNGGRTEYRLKQPREIDWKDQFDKATASFEKNGFLVLVGGRQTESLDEVVTVKSGTQVAFVKLTLLVGG